MASSARRGRGEGCRGAFEDAQIRLPQLKAVLAARLEPSLIAAWTSLASVGNFGSRLRSSMRASFNLGS